MAIFGKATADLRRVASNQADPGAGVDNDSSLAQSALGWVIDDIESHRSDFLYERFSGKLSEPGPSREVQEPFGTKLGCHRPVNTLAD